MDVLEAGPISAIIGRVSHVVSRLVPGLFCRWRDRGVWDQLLDTVIVDPDFEWLMIDASYIKVHLHGTGSPGGN